MRKKTSSRASASAAAAAPVAPAALAAETWIVHWDHRAGSGKILVRPLYIRWHDREFVILAVAPESQVDSSGFQQAVGRAKDRAKGDCGLDV
jgi:hypothetical protein